MIAIKQRQKACLRAGGPFHTATRHRIDAIVDVAEVEHEILHPERGALADRGRLRGLQVSRSERRLITPFASESAEGLKHAQGFHAQ